VLVEIGESIAFQGIITCVERLAEVIFWLPPCHQRNRYQEERPRSVKPLLPLGQEPALDVKMWLELVASIVGYPIFATFCRVF